jgi:hypothetical protein
MNKAFFIALIMIQPFFAACQNYKGRTVMGVENARETVKKSLMEKDAKPFYDTLIKDKETAIAVAEPILFNIYGKKNIIAERPYECYLIDGYWYISGTLPKGYIGGVFEIIIDSGNGKVIKLIHGK